jgi:methionyl-tRNA synthetase
MTTGLYLSRRASLQRTLIYCSLLFQFSDKLNKWLDTKTEWKENVTTFMKSMIKEGLRERAITRDLKWGVPLPLENTEGKVLYVWFDAPIGYISITKEWAINNGKPDDWKNYWLDKKTRIIHFIGKDNIPFHCIVWPSLLMGQDIKYNLPSDVPANEFYNLEGRQFSKSEGWYIDIDEFFKKYKTDSIRYAIAVNAPETKDSEFTWKDFQLRNNSELANIFGNFAHRTLAFIEKYMNGVIPKTGKSSDSTKQVLSESEKIMDMISENYSKFEVRKACFNIMELGRLANKFYDTEAPWSSRKDDMDKCNLTMETCCTLIARLAYVAYPVIPESSEKLWKMLGNMSKINMISWDKIKTVSPAGQTLNNPKILFKRIEDDTIKEEIEKLHKQAEAKKKSDKKTDGVLEAITIDDFKKISLSVGKIISAESVEKSKKLLKLNVSTGGEKRQIVAGIAEFYKPEALINKKVVVVANLKPAKIFGIKSDGMLLAARNKNKL